MSQSAFASTTRFKAAIALINNMDTSVLEKTGNTIVTRTIENNAENTFSEAEFDQLKEFLGVTSDELSTIISGSKYILDQACFFNLSAEKLLTQLREQGMNDDAASVFATIWHKSRSILVETLRDRTFGAPYCLSSLDWRLQVTMAHDSLSKTKHVNTILDMHLSDPSNELSPESLSLEFNKDQLLELYENLELIQSQVDKITK